MKKPKLLFVFFFLLSTFFIEAQDKFTLSGTIQETASNESLISVNILIPELQTGTTTNEYGFYSITLPKGTYQIIISYVGYADIVETINLSQNIVKNFNLNEASENLEEVIITDNIEKLNIKKPQMSVNALTTNTIKQIPAILGEADVVKAITLLPGVTNAGEGASGFNVRGGAADQNLILLD
ncbi:MAG: carboxypeptidase-like regulatory domain-containing protein, partial [Oceanihabitans sp.]